MARVRLDEIYKNFGEVQAVQGLGLDIAEGEFFSLLGPSGCGKSTTLRIIAGFEPPDRGRVLFDDQDVTMQKPNRRNTGMVFQNYALFPHLSVFENVAFGLRARKLPKAVIANQVQEALSLVEMAGFESRPVTQLSGGQQQRVALARALAIKPSILLLDEPLSNLDAQLRRSTRTELRRLQRRLGITTIYVTHDQEEALALSDRIAVMRYGSLQQVGTPQQIYSAPANLFVMNFIGDSNALPGKISGSHDTGVEISGRDWQIFLQREDLRQHPAGKSISLAFRPEHVSLRELHEAGATRPDTVTLRGDWISAEYSGTHWLAHVRVDGTRCTARLSDDQARALFGQHPERFPSGRPVAVEISHQNIFVFDAV